MPNSEVHFRIACVDDLPAIVQLLADDHLGATRERPTVPLAVEYSEAFAAIDRDPNNEIVVASLEEAIVGVLQITYIPNLTHMGSWRAMIEGVRVSSCHRSTGTGTQLLKWAISRSRSRGCRLVQLTSDLQRSEAIKFYERLGFRHSHAGLKLRLD